MNDQQATPDIAKVANRDELIRLLAKLRLRGDPEASQSGINEQLIDQLSGEKLSALPESTIVNIVETYYILKHKDMADAEIFQRIDMQRSLFAPPVSCPAGLGLRSYIDFRLKVEHAPLGRLDDAMVQMAILYAVKWFSAEEKAVVDWSDVEAFASRAAAGTREKYIEATSQQEITKPGKQPSAALPALLVGVALAIVLAMYFSL
jgi:hypothetical protein